MRHFILALTTIFLAASAPHSDTGQRVRYLDAPDRMSLTVNHDIDVTSMKSIATREFSFDLALSADSAAATITVTIDRASGSYTAHDMKQKLGTRHLTGRSFPLSIGDDGRLLERTEPSDELVIDLGPVITSGFSVSGLLADMLPKLPEQAVVSGSTWTTRRPVRFLEGWGWGNGTMTSRHRVTAVDERNEHTVVSVTTEGQATLGPLESERAFTGELKRTLDWTFDATDGRLLSISMEQESSGNCPLPQGETPIVQHTRVELKPRS